MHHAVSQERREAGMSSILARLVVIAALACAASVGAEEPSAAPRSGGTFLSAQAGFSTASPHMSGAAVGAALARDLGPRLALEVSGTYLDRGSGASAASLTSSLLVRLVPRQDKAVPYLAVGGGLYRTAFDTHDPRFSGARVSGLMGSGRYRHTMPPSPPGWDFGQAPDFYGGRLADAIAREGRTNVSFSDPTLTIGAGIWVRLGRSWSIRQDARAQVIVRSGTAYTVGVFTLQVGRGFGR